MVAPGITMLRLGLWPYVNSYLVEEPDGLTVFDTGFFFHGTTLEKAVAGRPVRRIVLTHFHPDHSGGCAYLSRITGAPVLVHELDAPFVMKEKRIEDEPGWWLTKLMLRMVGWIGLGQTEPPERLETFREGDMVGRFQVLHTPGHTPGSCSFWDGREMLLSGDNLVNITRLGFGVPFWTLDHPARKATLARYRGLGVQLLLPGHGRPWRGDLEQWVNARR